MNDQLPAMVEPGALTTLRVIALGRALERRRLVGGAAPSGVAFVSSLISVAFDDRCEPCCHERQRCVSPCGPVASK